MTGLEIFMLAMVLAATAAVLGFGVCRWVWPLRDKRLMRCPESGAVALVGTQDGSQGKGEARAVTVRSCDLWPSRKDCARGCLERYEQTATGYRVDVEALRPFERS